MKAQPGPMVSGSHFFPKAPLLWVKWIPACVVTSRKTCCAAERSGAAARKPAARRDKSEFEVRGLVIYLEAPAEIAAEAGATLPDWTAEATVATRVVVRGTDKC